MLHWLRAFAVCLLFATAGAALAADTKPYAREDMASDAVRLTETLRIEAGKIGAQAAGKSSDDLRKAANAAAVAGKYDVAQKLAAAAVTAAPKDPADWLAYADVAIKADDAKADSRWELVTQGATAAYAAYQHSTTPAAQAQALAVLGDLLARREVWRGALDAYKASLDRRDNIDVRKIYEAMREEHGFRILDYKVDNEFERAAGLFQLLRAARAQDGLCALCRGVGSVERRDLDRGSADLRRGPQARRALCDRAAPGPALGGRRIAAQGGRLRNLRPRQIAAGAFRRQGLRAAAPGPGGRAARHRQHAEGRDRSLPHRRPKPARDGEPRRFPQTDRHLARSGHREHGRREGLERLDGRRFRAQQGRGDGISRSQGRRTAEARRLSRHRAPVEGEVVRTRINPKIRSSRRNGWSSRTSV